MYFAAAEMDHYTTLNKVLLWMFYMYWIYVDICKKFYFFPDEVLCKSCIYKCNEGVDRYTAFIKDYVLTEQNLNI